MKTSTREVYILVLRVILTLAVTGYLLTIIGKIFQPNDESTFGTIMIYALFVLFVVGYLYCWKNEVISGLIIMIWHGLQWVFILWVWKDASITLTLGIPIFIIGILFLIYGLGKKKAVESHS
ncbi:MAG: hypothetical protein ISR55_03070 [Bacteroidetes bacterium]|nr:hypothetical protein [Bacteroidota bacterium]